MLLAYYEGKFIHIDDHHPSFLRSVSDEKKLVCPDCKKPLIFKEYEGKQNHFSHVNADCSYPFSEPESIEHETGKKAIFEWLKEQFSIDDCFVEKKVEETNQRSDTFVSSLRVACEFQCSPIQSKTWKKRTNLYKQAKIHDIWILGYSMHKYVNDSSFFHKINQLEESMLFHHGKIIYFDVLTKQFIFLIPEKKSSNVLTGVEYFFKPQEIMIKHHSIVSKYNYFIEFQESRRKFSLSEREKADHTTLLINEVKNYTTDKTKILATTKQINYIKFLLYKSHYKIPYKFHGLLKSEADNLIKLLEDKRKQSS